MGGVSEITHRWQQMEKRCCIRAKVLHFRIKLSSIRHKRLGQILPDGSGVSRLWLGWASSALIIGLYRLSITVFSLFTTLLSSFGHSSSSSPLEFTKIKLIDFFLLKPARSLLQLPLPHSLFVSPDISRSYNVNNVNVITASLLFSSLLFSSLLFSSLLCNKWNAVS